MEIQKPLKKVENTEKMYLSSINNFCSISNDYWKNSNLLIKNLNFVRISALEVRNLIQNAHQSLRFGIKA